MTKKEAVKLFGSQTKLANRIHLSREAICRWGWDAQVKPVYELAIRQAYTDMLEEQDKNATVVFGGSDAGN